MRNNFKKLGEELESLTEADSKQLKKLKKLADTASRAAETFHNTMVNLNLNRQLQEYNDLSKSVDTLIKSSSNNWNILEKVVSKINKLKE